MSQRRLTSALAAVPVFGLVFGLLWAVITGKPMYLALAIGAFSAAVAAYWFLPMTGEALERSILKKMLTFAVSGVSKVINVVLIVVVVNILTAVWFASGTIQSLVYYGLNVIKPDHLLLAGYILATFVSLVLGSSVGTLSTVGIAVMGMARSLGLPLGPVAGVLVSGALLGDKSSPVSPIFHLTYTMARSDQSRTFKKLMQTGLSAWFIVLGLYAFMEPKWTGTLTQNPHTGSTFLSLLPNSVTINLWLVIPPLLVLILAAFRVGVKKCLTFGLLSGIFLAFLFQGETVASLFRYALLGFDARGRYPLVLSQVMKGGGLLAAKNVILLLLFAGIYGGITEESGMIRALAEPLLRKLNSRTSILLGAWGLSFFSAAVASNQVLAIIIPATLLNEKTQEGAVESEDLARVLSDSGGAIAGLLPWNLMAIISAQALSYPTAAYAKYAYYLWVLPLLTVVFVLYGARAKRGKKALAESI